MEEEKEIFKIEFCKQFESIAIPNSIVGKYYFKSEIESDTTKLYNLKRINLLVGANNSGKSYLLRELFSNNKIENTDFNINEIEFEQMIETIIKHLNNIRNNSNIQIDSHLVNDYQNTFGKIKIRELKLKNFKIFNVIEILNTINRSLIYDNSFANSPLLDYIYNNKYQSFTQEKYTINKIFIYNFKSLSKKLHDIKYIQQTINANYGFKFGFDVDNQLFVKQYDIENNGIKINYIFENGHDFYTNSINKLLSDFNQREDYLNYEIFLKDYLFEGKKISLIPHRGNLKVDKDVEDIMYIKIGDDNEMPIYKLGTGLQMMILLTWPLFNYDSGILYIEEPETYLHPKFQNLLINLYSNHPRSVHFQFFITTHSNHIIDSIGNEDKISTYTVEKLSDDDFYVKHLNYGDTKPYELLGVKPSSLSFANGIIWVEGPSDMIYLKKWIELVNDDLFKDKKDKLVKGKHYEIMIYGGKNLSHFDFFSDYDDELTDLELEERKHELNKFIQILKINYNFILLADSDISNITDNESKGYNQKYNLITSNFEKNNIKEKFFFTSGRTIENYITKEMLSILTKDDIANEIDRFTPFFDSLKNYELPPYYESLKGKKNITKKKSLFANRISNITEVEHLKKSPNWDKDINSESNLYNQIKRMILQIREWNHLT